MNQEPQDKLEVSTDVVEQLNGMVRNSATIGAHGQGPDMAPGPGPTPSPTTPTREINS